MPIPPRPIFQRDTTSWALTLATREAYRSVVAVWQDTNSAQRQEVTAGEGAPVLKLRHVHATEAEATAAATAKLSGVERGADSFDATMPGDPLIAAEGRILAAGFRAGVNGLWSITAATHELSSDGFKTSISAELPAAN